MPDCFPGDRSLSSFSRSFLGANGLVVTVFLLLLCRFALFGQGGVNPSYLVKGRVMVSSGSVANVRARCVLNEEGEDLEVDDRGTFVAHLRWNCDYLFEFYCPGCIMKSVFFSTKVPAQIDKERLQPFLLLVRLNPIMEEVDTAYFKTPVGLVRYSQEINDFEPVTDYNLLVEYHRSRKSGASTRSKSQGATKQKPQKTTGNTSSKRSASMTNQSKSAVEEAKESVSDSAISESLENPYQQFLNDDEVYPPGITVDTFRLNRQTINRYILMQGKRRQVFLEVVHDWGPTYYFISDYPDAYRCISQHSFKSRLYQNR